MNFQHARHIAKAKDIERRVAWEMESGLSAHFNLRISIRLMDAASDAAWAEQWRPFLEGSGRAHPEGGWAWPSKTRFCRRDERKIGMVIWKDENLIGLSYAEKNNSSVKIVLLEGDPRKRYRGSSFNILLAFTLLFEAYAEEVGLRYVDLVEPLGRLIPRYEEFGYCLVRLPNQSTFMRKEV